jgi:hypothetical protein
MGLASLRHQMLPKVRMHLKRVFPQEAVEYGVWLFWSRLPI